jgi:hypothetical protein
MIGTAKEDGEDEQRRENKAAVVEKNGPNPHGAAEQAAAKRADDAGDAD